MTFFIGQDDTSPVVQTTLTDGDGTAQSVVGATVDFKLYNSAGALVVDAAAELVDAANGVVRYVWLGADTVTPGLYLGQWIVTYASSKQETFPLDGFTQVQISGPPTGYEVTIGAIKDGFATSASNSDIQGAIAVVDQADTCLTANAVAPALGRHLKTLGARHLLTNASDRGAVTQERAISGASRTYAERKAGETGHLDTLRTIDAYGCVMATVTKNARIQLRSVGRRSTET